MTAVDDLIRDLGSGQLDLDQAAKRIRALWTEATKVGAADAVADLHDRTAQLARENRLLRQRLVAASLFAPHDVRPGLELYPKTHGGTK
jgi:hypothetical protein